MHREFAEMEFAGLREAIEKVELVDAHAHNIVALDSSFPFINGFSEAAGDALASAPHSLSFKVLILLFLFLFPSKEL
uniref:Amidohydrolase-related domain-containing protein n=1 Tax=Rhizophora mucronata TaxID=61149 RepID=A0A2P2KJB2_RHIMU